jgi:diadenosine tetraphosphate (Ap4A) HIT family hydrolase
LSGAKVKFGEFRKFLSYFFELIGLVVVVKRDMLSFPSIPSLADMSEEEIPIAERLIKVAYSIAKENGITERGYRLVINAGKEWGQEIQYLHLHLLSKREVE